MPKKVIHIVTRLDFGGAQQNTLYTAGHLDPARFEVILVCGPGGRLDGRAEDLARGSRPVRLRFIEDLVREISPIRDLAALCQLTRFLRDVRPDIVHTHSSKAGILGRIAARLAGVPVILHTFHGFAFHELMPPPARALYVFFERIAAAVCARLIFVSRSNMDYARAYRLGRPERYVLIRSGVKLSALPASLGGPRGRRSKRAAVGIRPEPPLVVSIGNLKAQKNCMDFVRIAESVLARNGDASFIFIGDGPLRGKFEDAVRRGKLEGKVALLGWRDDAREILAASDIFLLTSLWEGLPRALVEAMKTGLPSVAYNVDGVQDVLRSGRNGYALAPKDWKGAAERIVELIADPALRRRMGIAAADSIGEEFDIDAMVRKQEALYEELTA